jgi:serine/threonine-protein kinase
VTAHDVFEEGEVVSGVFEIRGKLGEGGMGQVYAAVDRSLGRKVAIKVARPGVEEWLDKEGRGLAALHHPCVVTVYGAGRHHGVRYLALEHVPGRTLEALLGELREQVQLLPLREAVDLLRAIAEGLSVVHGAGMAHCDVKPANVMLAPRGRVVLTDFGTFQLENDAPQDFAFGSPPYMAPEAVTMTARTGELFLVDVYALGVIGYELLTGAVPFYDERTRRLRTRPSQPPDREVMRARGSASMPLALLVGSMMSPDPASRPQSADEIAWQLRRWHG